MSAHARPYPATVSVSPVSRTVSVRPADETWRLVDALERVNRGAWPLAGCMCDRCVAGRALKRWRRS